MDEHGTGPTRWQRNAATLWRSALGTAVLLAPGADGPITISPPGAAIWALLEQPVTADEIVEALVEALCADPAVVRPDVESLLAQLHDLGAVVTH